MLCVDVEGIPSSFGFYVFLMNYGLHHKFLLDFSVRM